MPSHKATHWVVQFAPGRPAIPFRAWLPAYNLAKRAGAVALEVYANAAGQHFDVHGRPISLRLGA